MAPEKRLHRARNSPLNLLLITLTAMAELTRAVEVSERAANSGSEGSLINRHPDAAAYNGLSSLQQRKPDTPIFGLLSPQAIGQSFVERDDTPGAPGTTATEPLATAITGTLLPSNTIPTTLLTITASPSFADSLSQTSILSSTATHPPFSDLAPGGQHTSAPAATSTNTVTTDFPPGAGGDDNDTSSITRNSLVNYFFVFLGLLVVVLIIAIYYIHKRKREKKAQSRNSGQNALARDLEGWVNTRRWVHGGWRGGEPSLMRREEGLNEFGEAPPPYEPPMQQAQNSSNAPPANGAAAAAPAEVITPPARTLTRENSAPSDIQPLWQNPEGARNRPPSYPDSETHVPTTPELLRPNPRF